MNEEMQVLQTEINRLDVIARSMPEGEDAKACRAKSNELQAQLDSLKPKQVIADMEAEAAAREAEAGQLAIAQNAPFTGEIPVA